VFHRRIPAVVLTKQLMTFKTERRSALAPIRVNAADRERLLAPRNWAELCVSDWFRSKNNRPDKRHRINDRDRDQDLRSAAASSHGVVSGGGAAPVDDVTAQRVDACPCTALRSRQPPCQLPTSLQPSRLS